MWWWSTTPRLSAHMLRRSFSALLSGIRALVLGVATGATPLPVYRALARGSADFSRGTRGRAGRVRRAAGRAPGVVRGVRRARDRRPARARARARRRAAGERCQELERRIAELGGVDLQLLGIGRNGHLAFNEPGSPLDSRSRVVALSETTRRDNARDFGRRAGPDARGHPGARHHPRGAAPRAARHRRGQGGRRRRSAHRPGDAGLPCVRRPAAPAGHGGRRRGGRRRQSRGRGGAAKVRRRCGATAPRSRTSCPGWPGC